REPPAEPRDQPIFHARDLFRVSIASNNHLLMRVDQGVEGVEELLLCSVLAAEELNVIDQQEIERVIVFFESVECLVLVSANYIGYILLGVDISHTCLRVLVMHQIANRLNQMRLAKH